MAGFETVPFSYHLTQLLNDRGAETFKTLTETALREVTLVPSLLKRPVCYDSL